MINASRVFDIENHVPQSRTTVTLKYAGGDLFSGFVRLNSYGDWESMGGAFSPI